MEHQDSQRQKGIEHFYKQGLAEQRAPDSLLSAVLNRVEHLNTYRTTQMSEQEIADSLSDPRWEVRAIAIYALSELGEQAPLDPFVVALHDEDPTVRAAAVQALGQMGERIPFDQLIIALQDREWEVRERVVLVLGELMLLREHTVKPLLMAALQDTHKAVRNAAKNVLEQYDAASISSKSVFQQREERIAVQTPGAAGYWHSLEQSLSHFWLVLIKQLSLLQEKGIITMLLLFLSYSLTLFILQFHRNIHDAALSLGLVTTIATAMGIAFTVDARHDAGVEVTLSTPTSLRMIILCRFLLVIGSNFLLSVCASTIIALLYGQSAWVIIQLWIGPLFFISSLMLALAPLMGSWLSFLVTCLLEVVQTLRFGPGGEVHLLEHSFLWQMNPTLLLLAVLCFVFAFLYIPRQDRLLQE
ncbi:MAG: HEAT repeat domain-containing protein [Chloroflexota bacterium]|nr:HEAT repeat domain-containing protein [Chloroflexota bacterium]